jgi:hypothetical protein
VRSKSTPDLFCLALGQVDLAGVDKDPSCSRLSPLAASHLTGRNSVSRQRIGKLVIKSTAEDSAPLDKAIQSLAAPMDYELTLA